MRKISNGFTLIELLLTMGIIGIVAALTIPGLVSKFSNAHFGATLGSTAQRIELGLRNLIDTANKNYAANGESTTDLLTTIKTKDIKPKFTGDDNYIIDSSSSSLFGSFGDITGVDSFDNSTNPEGEEEFSSYIQEIKGFSGGSRTEGFLNADDTASYYSRIYKIHNTSTFLYPVVYLGSLDENKINTDSIIGYIYIDVNSFAKPNREGQDIFLFGLTAGGTLVPAGTDVFNNGIEDWGAEFTIPTAEEGCVNGSVTNGLSCTARVVKEEWKLNYMK